jgi:hypothetical protein
MEYSETRMAAPNFLVDKIKASINETGYKKASAEAGL